MDKIFLKDFKLSTVIGVFPEEREAPQELWLNLELRCDLRRAGESDKLEDAVDYFALYNELKVLAENSAFGLLEAFAAAVADICLAKDAVESVVVSLAKSPAALPDCRCAVVEIERFKKN